MVIFIQGTGYIAAQVKLMSSNWIKKPRRYNIYIRDGFACAYCGTQVTPADQRGKGNPATMATLDHIIPRSQGGNNTSSNLVCSCLSCNASRKDTPLFEYLDCNIERIMVVIRQTEKMV